MSKEEIEEIEEIEDENGIINEEFQYDEDEIRAEEEGEDLFDENWEKDYENLGNDEYDNSKIKKI
jgi:hypothetical protein